MVIKNSLAASSYGYGMAAQASNDTQKHPVATNTQRETYGTNLLPKLDERAYEAFVNATAGYSDADRRLAAQTFERVAAVSAANQYAVSHDIELTSDLALVYDFFKHYKDVVSTDQIKNLLNTRLADVATVEGEKFESEQFFADYMAQLGGSRTLDIRV